MGVSAGPQLVTNGLILHLDIANRRSFLDSGGSQRSLLSTSTWSLGGGGVTGYGKMIAHLDLKRLLLTLRIAVGVSII